MTQKSAVIRVVVVDDSPVVVEMMRRLIDRTPDMLVVGTAHNARDAREAVTRLKPDLVTMDITLPGDDGIAATRDIMRERPTPIAVVTAHPVGPGSEITFHALAAGAVDVLAKPRADAFAVDPSLSAGFLRELRLIAGVGVLAIKRSVGSDPSEVRLAPVAPANLEATAASLAAELQVIGVGASTGGPPAIRTLLSQLKRATAPAVVVVQHMGSHFVEGFASWLGSCIELDVQLARHGGRLTRGTVVVAAPHHHVLIDADLRVQLSDAPPEHGNRPAIDPLFESLARNLGQKAVGIVLTGMGEDGARGLRAMRERGAVTMAQDEVSSLVYGMPHKANELGAAALVASPTHMGRLLARPGGFLLSFRSTQRTYLRRDT